MPSSVVFKSRVSASIAASSGNLLPKSQDRAEVLGCTWGRWGPNVSGLGCLNSQDEPGGKVLSKRKHPMSLNRSEISQGFPKEAKDCGC